MGPLLYLSNGNIPSRWAHTVQTLKMSEALAELTPRFELVIGASLRDRLSPRVDLWRWYGIERPFPVTPLPLWLWRRSAVFTSVRERRFSWAAPRYAARARPALVWTRSYPIAAACLARGLSVIFERHSASPPKWERLIRTIGSAPSLRAFIANSEALRAAHVAAGIPDAKLAAFANGVAPALLAAQRGDTRAARRALGLPEHARVALYAGSLSAEKGLPTLLAAAAQLPDVRFLVLGGSDADVVRWKREAGANVELRGFVPNAQLASWFAAADVGLFPNSARDPLATSTSPLKVLEYVAAGLPVVATAIPAVTSWLRDRETAFLAPPDDPAAFAAAIARALREPQAAAACAARAREENVRFTWRDRAQQILARFAPELIA
ncbi:MAG TPA: glycosyltransferase family 4 protein [Myxococcota bacterium]|nr:glycosyltransferase family 4 protein [Myxococcota bacterium]